MAAPSGSKPAKPQKTQQQKTRIRAGSMAEFVRPKKKFEEPKPKTSLEDPWTFYYMHTDPHLPKKKISYTSALKRVFTADSIEDFWSAFNHLPPLYDLLPNTDYMIFKADVRPEWEAPANREGGKWVLTIDTKDLEELNVQEIWETLLAGLVGASFVHYEYINGIVASIRERHVRFSMWTYPMEDWEELRKIGKYFKELTKLPPKYQAVYQLHLSALNKQLDNNYFSAI